MAPKYRKHKWTVNEFIDSARDHLGALIEKLDPLETIAIVAATVLIKDGIDWTQFQLSKMTHLYTLTPFGVYKGSPETTGAIGLPPDNETAEWMLAFVAAYFAIRNADKITGSILSFATGFLKR